MAFRKYVAEFIGTAMLVVIGCGTAVGATTLTGGALSFGVMVAIGLAFGIAVIIAAYSIGSVSGAHLNPAVSVAMLIVGRISAVDFLGYVLAQVLGGIAGAALLGNIAGSYENLGANGYGELSYMSTNGWHALLIEVVLTFVFVLAVLGVTAQPECSNVAGIVIGFSLTGVVMLGLPFTGTSVNPARSLGPALLEGGLALDQVWLFVLAPLVGGVVAAVVYFFLVEAPTYSTTSRKAHARVAEPVAAPEPAHAAKPVTIPPTTAAKHTAVAKAAPHHNPDVSPLDVLVDAPEAAGHKSVEELMREIDEATK